MAKRGRPKKTMRVRFLVAMAGPEVVRSLGSEEEVETAEALRLIEAGFAEAVREPAAGRSQAVV